MKCIKLMAFAAILMPMLFSCSGGSGSSNTPLFGALPGEYAKMQEEKDALQEEAKNIKSQADKAKLIEKSEKMQAKWGEKLEECAKGLDGKPIEFQESDIKITEPLSLQFDGFFSKSSMNPKFKINGSAEAATDINTDTNYVIPSETVYIVAYNADGEIAYKEKAGHITAENVDGMSVIKAGTPVIFDVLHFSGKSVEEYEAGKTLKLEVLR